MKQVSDAYKQSMSGLLRNNSSVKVSFGNIDTTAAFDGKWVSNGELSFSEVETLDYDYETENPPYATLELNRWLLDGTLETLPEGGYTKQGFISDKISNINGQMPTETTLTRNFNAPHTFPGITFVFDRQLKQWVRSLSVSFYYNNSLLLTKTITDINTDYVPVEALIENTNKIKISFLTLMPYYRPRIKQIIFGVFKSFTNKNIVSTKQTHDVDPLTRRVPKETFEFSILDLDKEYDADNPTGIWSYVDEKAPIDIGFGYELADGSIEQLAPDRYVLDGRPTVKKSIATFKGTGLIGSMNKLYYKSTFGSKNFYDMATAVLIDAQLTPTKAGENPWVIDESLKTMTTTAPLPVEPHNVCLQIIAHACRCKLYTDDENIIHIEPFVIPKPSDFYVSFDTVLGDTQASTKIDALRAVDVHLFSYNVFGSVETLYEGTTTSTFLHIDFPYFAQNVTVSVTGGTVVSSSIYAKAIDLTLSTGNKTIKITGKTVQISSSIYTKTVSDKGEIDEEKNPLITSSSMQIALADHVSKYLVLRNTYDLSYRGNPELETGDVINIQTPFSEVREGLILTDEISFSGTLKGALKVKVLK